MSTEIDKNISEIKINNEEEDVVNPWNVTSTSQEGVDYDKLISMQHAMNICLR